MLSDPQAKAIAVDAMGGDKGPAEVVHGVALSLKNNPFPKDIEKIILVGQEDLLLPTMKEVGIADNPAVEVYHASEVIGMDDKPLQGLKQKKDSSMVRALALVKDGQARALLSCGNTGSLMAGGTLRIRPLEGIERPALATIIPTRENRFILLDAGANPDPTPLQMCHNAILGSNYASHVLGQAKPRVGLLTIGTEEGKGSQRIQESHQKLKQLGGLINYDGLIEGFQVFENKVDVVLCDGFTGNVVLKVCESLFKMLSQYVKDELSANLFRKAGALLSIGAYKAIRKELNPAQFGGAPLLGLKAPVLKAHGSSDRWSIAGALRVAMEALQTDMTTHIHQEIAEANQILQPGKDIKPEKVVAS